MNLEPNTLVYLVQLVDQRILQLKAEVDSRDPEDETLTDYEEELLECSKAAMELKRLYQQAEKTTGNLPAYALLVRE